MKVVELGEGDVAVRRSQARCETSQHRIEGVEIDPQCRAARQRGAFTALAAAKVTEDQDPHRLLPLAAASLAVRPDIECQSFRHGLLPYRAIWRLAAVNRI